MGELRNPFFLLRRSFKREPGEAGAGGIIYDLGGKIVESFAWGLGTKSNNEAEWLALMYGIELMAKINIDKETIIGGSRQVIQKMQRGYRNGNTRCKRIVRRISQIIEGIDLSFVHILRGNNGKANSLANEGGKLEIGCVVLHTNGPKHHPIP